MKNYNHNSEWEHKVIGVLTQAGSSVKTCIFSPMVQILIFFATFKKIQIQDESASFLKKAL